MIFVVETQINKRMARLTKAVLAIAGGKTDYKVDVSGADELGSMATALEVFRLNAEELRRSNIELEKFAYVAAHDLRSPLRAIQDLAEWTLEDSENVFSADSRCNMDLLQSRIGRLNKLLSDLLEYSRAGKETEDVSEISMECIVNETAELLDPNGNYGIRHLGPCDVVQTFSIPFRQIVLNLINNAIKHHDRKEGAVTVETYLDGDRIRCSVQDDGPGIPPEYHDRIFGLFQTLRPRDEVEGSGLGLAIIYKLLEHYGGSIQVQSDPDIGRGCKFTFDLPTNSDFASTYNQAA